MRIWRNISYGCMLLAALFMVLSVCFPDSALATPTPAAGADDDFSGGAFGDVKQKCKEIRDEIAQEDVDGAWLTEYIVTCVKTVVQDAFSEFINQLYPFFETIIRVAMTLAVTFFGVGLLTGMIEKTSRDSFLLLFKIAAVSYFVTTDAAQWLYQNGNDAMDGLTDLVFTFGKEASEESERCPDNDTLWDRVDCMLDVMIGIRREQAETGGNTVPAGTNPFDPDSQGIKRGMLHFFFSNLSSSGMGAVAIAFLGLYTVFTLLIATIKSIHTYLAAVLGLSFVLIFCPMFVPMVFFRHTKNYFDKWYRIGMSFVLQPVILFGYLSLMMVALDKVLVSGDNSVLQMITGDQCTDQTLSKCLEERGIYRNQNLTTFQDIDDPTDSASILNTRTTGALEEPATDTSTGSDALSGMSGVIAVNRPFDSVNYERLGQILMDGDRDEQVQEKLTYAAIILALTAFVFISMLNYIPIMATDLTGGMFEVPNLYQRVGSHYLGSDQVERMAQGISRTVRGRYTNADGTPGHAVSRFVQRLEGMVTGRS